MGAACGEHSTRQYNCRDNLEHLFHRSFVCSVMVLDRFLSTGRYKVSL